MYILTIIEIILITIYSGYLIQQVCTKEVNLFVKFMALISWVINFVMLIFIPLDIYITLRDSQLQLATPSLAYLRIAEAYQWLYWANFIICWTIIPIMQEYEEAVDLTRHEKLVRAFVNNIKFYVIIAVVGIVFVVCIVLTGSAKQYGLGTFLKSLANSFGVLLITVLLGYSLVTVPRAHMRTAQLPVQMKYLYFRAASIFQEKKDIYHSLEDLTQRAVELKEFQYDDELFTIYLNKCVDKLPKKLVDKIVKREKEKKSGFLYKLKTNFLNEGVKKPEFPYEVMELYQQVRKGVQELKRVKAQWKENCLKALEMEDILSSDTGDVKRIKYTFKPRREGRFAQQFDTIEWYWQLLIKPQLKIIFSLLLGILSITVLIQEITVFMPTSFTIFGVPLKFTSGIIAIQVFTFIPLFYMAFCVFYGLFRIKIAGFYGLYDNNQTDAPSLMFATINFSRVGAPLCHNYLSMLRLKQTSAFHYAMGHIELVPIFGIDITSFLPLLLIFLFVTIYFDLYDKFMNMLGMKQFMFTATFSDRLIYEGREALQNRKTKLLRRKKTTVELQIVDGTGGNQDRLL